MSTTISGLPPDPILERRELIHLRIAQTSARRTLLSRILTSLSILGIIVSFVPLGSVILSLIFKGAHYLTWNFLTTLPKLPSLLSLNTIGGIGNSIAATIVIDLLAAAVAIPFGVVVGLYISQSTPLARALRAVVEIMTGIPSILLGVFAYEYFVVYMKSYSGLAALIALAMLMVPVIAKAAELAFRDVPIELSEAALALGARESRVVWKVVIPVAMPGVITGVLLAMARAVGETAPVLLVAGPTISNLWNWSPFHPMTPMPMLIFGYANSQYPSERGAAWGVAFALVLMVVVLMVSSRLISTYMRKERRR